MTSENRSILVVDDSPTVRRLVELILTQHGFTVHTAEDGEEGLEVAFETKPDAILVDFVMPRMNGHVFCKTLRETEGMEDTPIILISSKGEVVGQAFEEQFGVLHYFSKPFEPEDLLSKLDEVFGPGSFSYRNTFYRGGDVINETMDLSVEFKNNIFHSFKIKNYSNPNDCSLPGLKIKEESIQEDEQINDYKNNNELMLRKKWKENDLSEGLRDFSKCCRSIRKYQFVPKEIKKDRTIDLMEQNVPFMQYDGNNLVNVHFFDEVQLRLSKFVVALGCHTLKISRQENQVLLATFMIVKLILWQAHCAVLINEDMIGEVAAVELGEFLCI